MLLGLLCFFLGALPVALVILDNGVSYYWNTLREILIATRHEIHPPQNYSESLLMRFEAVRGLLTEDSLLREPFPALGYAAPLIGKAVLCALLWLPLSCLLKGGTLSAARRLLLPVYIAVSFAVLSISGHYETNHQLLLLPPLILMTAAAAADLARRFAGTRAPAVLALLALAWLGIAKPWQLQRQLRTMTDSPPEYTDAIPAAASWLDANMPPGGPLLADSGLVEQMQFYLTRRRVLVSIPGRGQSFPDSARRADFYIAFQPDQTSRLNPSYSNLRLAMERFGARAPVVASFNDRGGRPMILIYRLPQPRPDLLALLAPPAGPITP
jgi:hypothetical protein